MNIGDPHDRAFFIRELTIMLAGWGREATVPVIEAYARVLEGLTRDDFQAAITRTLAKDASFCPPPGVILASAPGRLGHIQAWTQLRASVVRGDVERPLAMRLALEKMGGSKRIANADVEANDKREREFEHVWAQCQSEADDSEARARQAAKAAGPVRSLPAATSPARQELGAFVGVEQKNKFLQQTFSEMSASSRFAREQAADPNPVTMVGRKGLIGG